MKVAKAGVKKALARVARAVSRARVAKKLTQRELAVIVDVKAGTVAGWETARHGIRPGRLRVVAKALDLPMSELVA